MSAAIGIPKNFVATNVTESTVELTWLPPNEEEENNFSYQVSMRKAGGFLFKKNPETLFVTKDKNYTVKSLDNGTEYEFRIRCGYIGKWGKWSERIIVKCGNTQGSNPQTTGSSSEDSHCDSVNAYSQDRCEGLTLKDVFIQAGLTEEQFEEVWTACYKKAEELNEKGELPEDLSIDDAAIIAMYTFDFGAGGFEHNPSTIINDSIKEGFGNACVLAHLLLTTLRKLPIWKGRTLYRGIKCKVERSEYKPGNIVTWPTFSSAYLDMTDTRKFLARGSSDGKSTGTFFIIERVWGYDIRPYSLHPDSCNIILEPERQFEVASVIGVDLAIVTLEMVNSPLVPSYVF